MDVLWDEAKNKKLKAARGISFEDVALVILDKKYQAVLENPSHPEQLIFIVPLKGYTYVVPFVIDNDDDIVLKTAYPSRKFHKLFGEERQ